MFSALNTAVSGLQQFEQDIQVIGNNIANVNTTGYKDARISFEDTFSQALGASSASNQIGSGVTTAGIQNLFSQGAISSTGQPSDLAINGQGFFLVRNSSDGSEYATRSGEFKEDTSGYLVNSDGLRLQGYSDSGLSSIGDLKIDATGAPSTAASGATVSSWGIDQFGKINVTLSDGTKFVRGQVLLQNYTNPGALVKAGGNLYTASTDAGPLSTAAAPNASGLGEIQSGALEMSNVDLTSEMTNLISAQRAFQANARIITTSDEVLQEIVGLKR